MILNSENYKLSKLLSEKKELIPIFQEISTLCGNKLIILFGSYAKGLDKNESDIDIFIESDDINLKKRVEETNSKLSVKIGVFDTKELLIKEIIKNHIIINHVEEFYEKTRFFD